MSDIELINYLLGNDHFNYSIEVGLKEIRVNATASVKFIDTKMVENIKNDTGYDFYVMSGEVNRYRFIFTRKQQQELT